MEFLRTGIFDVVLTHNRFTLLDRSAEPLIAEAYAGGIGVLNAAVYGGGLLAKGPSARTGTATAKQVPRRLTRPELSKKPAALWMPLRAAALQFSTKDLRISSTIVGTATPDHVDELVQLLETNVPEQIWSELEELVPPELTGSGRGPSCRQGPGGP